MSINTIIIIILAGLLSGFFLRQFSLFITKDLKEKLIIPIFSFEIISPLLIFSLFFIIGESQFTIKIIPYIFLILTILPISFIDYKYRIIPDTITFSLMAVGFLASFFSYITPLESISGLIIGGGILYSIAIFGKLILKKEDGMGGGDTKLIAAFGAFLGIFPVLVILFLASILALLYVLVLKIRGKEVFGIYIPFGPFLSIAMVLSLFVWIRL